MRKPKGYRLKRNPVRGTPPWLIPLLVIAGGYLAYAAISSGTKAVQAAVAPPKPTAQSALQNILGFATQAISKPSQPAASSGGIPGIVTSYDQL